MKQLIENLKLKTNGLDNLGEKDAMEYESVQVDELDAAEHVKELDEIAKALTELVVSHKFREEDEDHAHPFLSCAEELAKQVGLDKITVCPYKGQIHNVWLDSNFMWHKQEDGHSSLTIDVYYTYRMLKEFVHEQILMELYNFKRDAQWVVDGVYEAEMGKFA